MVLKGSYHKIVIDINSLVVGDFGAGALLITYGALLGKINAS